MVTIDGLGGQYVLSPTVRGTISFDHGRSGGPLIGGTIPSMTDQHVMHMYDNVNYECAISVRAPAYHCQYQSPKVRLK